MAGNVKKALPASPDNESKPLGKHLGNVIKDIRQQHGLTIAEVAERANISRGMLSKIENGLVSTSLDTLEQLANSLGVTISRLFQGYNQPTGGAQLVKKGQGMEVVRRGTRNGHTYHLLAYDQGPKKLFEPFLITLEDPGEEFPSFEHSGTEFLYMLEGELGYRVGEEVYMLEPGDALTFRGEIPHRPEYHAKLPIRFLAIIHYDTEESVEHE
ncbi:helix-turn-helix domain-containing protein [Methylobacillus pratensis]